MKVKKINSILLLILLFGCSGTSITEPDTKPIVSVELNPRLNVDSNGYYHLTIDTTKWQTLHRLSGTVYADEYVVEAFRVQWESSHYWYLGDTLGYIVNRGLTDDLVYVNYDTSYVIGFDGYEVPTINSVSYSNGEGEINTMFAPTKNMRSDTVKIMMSYWDYNYEVNYKDFMIVLD